MNPIHDYLSKRIKEIEIEIMSLEHDLTAPLPDIPRISKQRELVCLRINRLDLLQVAKLSGIQIKTPKSDVTNQTSTRGVQK